MSIWNISSHKHQKHEKENGWIPRPEPEPFINQNLVAKVDAIQKLSEEDRARLFDSQNLSEIERMFENACDRDLIVVCMIAVRKMPYEYITILLDYIREREEEK